LRAKRLAAGRSRRASIASIGRTVALKRKDAKGVKATKATPGEYAASRPLKVVQIDRTEADVFLVDETTRKTVDKRLSLTLAIDVSRAGRRELSMDKSSRKTVCWRLDASALVGILPYVRFGEAARPR
jgi:hypothetical protein